jgi:NADH dehydrogenase/NADH:ubiquinone oxidoreductase subunit G
VIYDGGFATPTDLTQAKAQLRSGKIKAVVLFGVDPAGLADLETPLAQAEFLTAIDVFPNAATERAEIVIPLTPLQEEDGSVVSFDGRITTFRRVFKPLAGFSSVEFLGEALVRAGGARLDLAAIRQAIAAALPLYRSLASATPTAYLSDQAALQAAVRAFAMVPVSATPGGGTYQSATTFSRVTEATLRAKLVTDVVAELSETR